MRKTNINWLKKKREGLYCVPGNFFIDPVFPVEKALITHAHTDHARPNNKSIFSSKETIELMHLRYGESYCSDFQIARFDEKIKINDVTVQIYPAGHILGSIQFLINYNGYRLLISGDYKRTKDKTCLSYEPVECDTFITEATFGLPIFNHPNDQDEVKKLIKSNIPIFGICLGHQILALSLNGKTKKMKLGHRGANHPVKNQISQKVEITSQNHGFEVVRESLNKNIIVTHTSLFDNSIEGIKLKNKPVFSVQYHPESNPGPQDSHYLFSDFIKEVKKYAKKKRH